MIHTTDTFAKVRPGIYEMVRLFELDQDHHYRRTLGMEIDSDNPFEEIVQYGDLGVAQNTREAGGIPYGQISTPFSEKVYLKQFSIGVHLSMQVAKKRLYKSFARPTEAMAEAMYTAMEVDHASMWNNSTNTAADFLGMDGLPFSSNAHLTQGSTFSNRSTAAALSPGALQTMVQDVSSQRTYADQVWRSGGGFNLLTGMSQDYLAWLILNSNGQQGTADNDANGPKRSIQYVPGNPYWTAGGTRYVLLPRQKSKNPVYRINGLPATYQDDLDSDNGTYKYFVMQEWVWKWRRPQGVQFNEGL